jgi:hypothetical protein
MAKKKKLKVSANYLDYVPKLVPENKLECDEKGQITILMENKGFFNAIAKIQLFLEGKTPSATLFFHILALMAICTMSCRLITYALYSPHFFLSGIDC